MVSADADWGCQGPSLSPTSACVWWVRHSPTILTSLVWCLHTIKDSVGDMGVKRSRRPTYSSLSVPLPVCSSIPGKRECNVKPAGIKRFPRMDYLPRLRYLSQFCLQFYYFWRKKTLGSLRKDRLPRPVFLLLLVPF